MTLDHDIAVSLDLIATIRADYYAVCPIPSPAAGTGAVKRAPEPSSSSDRAVRARTSTAFWAPAGVYNIESTVATDDPISCLSVGGTDAAVDELPADPGDESDTSVRSDMLVDPDRDDDDLAYDDFSQHSDDGDYGCASSGRRRGAGATLAPFIIIHPTLHTPHSIDTLKPAPDQRPIFNALHSTPSTLRPTLCTLHSTLYSSSPNTDVHPVPISS